jgi:hypothetical protein
MMPKASALLAAGTATAFYLLYTHKPVLLHADTHKLGIKVSDSRSAFDLFCFHRFMVRREGEVIWRSARASLFVHVICSLGMFLSGGLAFPWLVEFYYQSLVQANPELGEAVEVHFRGEDLLVPCLKSAALNLLTLGADFVSGGTHARLAEVTGGRLRFREGVQFL